MPPRAPQRLREGSFRAGRPAASEFNNGSSALFVLVRKVTPDKVLAELKGTGGIILQTSLAHEEERKLQGALNGAMVPAET